MNSITLENFRCFGALQTARLAPLTLLVGENSAGKTSFLALVRALWDVAIVGRVPNFREPPYDLGSFREVAHGRGARGGRADSFKVGFEDDRASHMIRFEEQNTAPYPVTRRLQPTEESWIKVSDPVGGQGSMKVHAGGKEWVYSLMDWPLRDDVALTPLSFYLNDVVFQPDHALTSLIEGKEPGREDYDRIRELLRATSPFAFREFDSVRPFANAPVRSKPLRTYDPSRPARDAEGENTPSYLADLFRSNQPAWISLKERIEQFGKDSGLFNEIKIKSFGNTGGSPFQVQVRKHGNGLKGPWRNIVDVGYGVSQALPIIVDLFRKDMPSISLLQQPEVHLHPSAQAALGSLFCSVAGEQIISNSRGSMRRSRRQIIVETHSDYIMDRVRMDVRDKKTNLKPKDVSILFFERAGLDVKIHSLRIDEQGNVLDAPPGYRQFFLDELNRSVGF